MNTTTAVIDIGSNSVRLVIYRIEGRSIWPVFNEKVLAGLGRDLKATGTLHEGGRRETMIALRRFKAILESYELDRLHVVATAAVREAGDGPDFVADVARQTGLEIRVLSGAEEAFYSAQGVRCGHLDAEGIVGDLGGSSLELIDLGTIEAGVGGITLPLGPFALGAPKPLDPERTAETIRRELEPYKTRFRHKQFHPVGGAWRNLALIWMQKQFYPLEVIQQFEMPAREALGIARFIASQSLSSLEKVPGVTKRRLENISYAALVLQGLIETLNFETLCFSAFGLREGLLFEALDDKLKLEDPLIAGCAALGGRLGITDDLGAALAKWALHFYRTTPVQDRPSEKLIRAASKLADIGARLHPDHRADLACDQVLRAPIPGQNHRERVFLACAIYTRYSGDPYAKEPVLISRILGDDGLQSATKLGLLLRLGCDLSAKSSVLLDHAHLTQQNNQLTLAAMTGWEDLLLGEQTRRRARALANGLKLQLNIVTE